MMRFGSRMYIALVPNRSSPPAVLLRESYRYGDSVKTRPLANLTRWPADKVEALRRVLKGETSLSDPTQRFQIERSLPHGHVAAVLGMALSRLRPKTGMIYPPRSLSAGTETLDGRYCVELGIDCQEFGTL